MGRIIRVMVYPGAKKEQVVVDALDRLTLYIREPALRNMANRRVIELVARYAGVPIGNVRLRTGQRGVHKTLEIFHIEQ